MWAAAATHALAEQWRAVSASSLEQLERAPVIAALRKRQDRASTRAAAGGGDGEELLRRICADDPEGASADDAVWQAICLGSPAGDPLGPATTAARCACRVEWCRREGRRHGRGGAPSLTRQQSSAQVASRQSVLSNGLHVQCHHVEGAMVDETTMDDASGSNSTWRPAVGARSTSSRPFARAFDAA